MKTTLFTLLPLAFVAGVMAAAPTESTSTGNQTPDGKTGALAKAENNKGGPKSPGAGELKLPTDASMDPLPGAPHRVWVINADFTAKGYSDKMSKKEQGIDWQRLNAGFVNECQSQARAVLPHLTDDEIYSPLGPDPHDPSRYLATCFSTYTDPKGEHFLIYYMRSVIKRLGWTANEIVYKS